MTPASLRSHHDRMKTDADYRAGALAERQRCQHVLCTRPAASMTAAAEGLAFDALDGTGEDPELEAMAARFRVREGRAA
jgi:hypothetical protein